MTGDDGEGKRRRGKRLRGKRGVSAVQRRAIAYRDIMAGKRSTGQATRRRGQARDAQADRWLLLVGVIVAIILVVGLIGPRPPSERGVPVAVRPLSAAEARASNAAVPIEARGRIRAAPFRFTGGPAAREQAVDCLATAAIYEAGDSGRGQRAVMQVVLNRVRAPGFPKTVCGVVYQGYARTTGCQFSFTCDGSFQRRAVHSGWGAARLAARRALAGRVDAGVGRATHYHADWIVPYWRGSLTKVAQVGTHLFYVRCAMRAGKRAC